MLMNREQIKEVLPHREPFLLVDEVEEMEVVEDELDSIQKEVLISQLKSEINDALESMDSQRFMELTNRLKELEDE